MIKFSFLGNGEFHKDHATMTVKTLSILALTSNGRLRFHDHCGNPLSCIEISKLDGAILMKFRAVPLESIVDWGMKPPDRDSAAIPVIAEIISGKSEDRFFPITMDGSADDGRPVVVASAC